MLEKVFWAGLLCRYFRSTAGQIEVAWPHIPCIRLFHSHGSIGCGSPAREPEKILLRSVNSHESLQELLVGLEDDEKIALVMDDKLFGRDVVDLIISDSGHVGGVLLLRSEPCDFSGAFRIQSCATNPDSNAPYGIVAPDATADVDPTHVWNPRGSGVMWDTFPFPIVLLEGEAALQAKDWGSSTSLQYPRYTALLDFYFGASGGDSSSELNSQMCLEWTDLDAIKRPKCLPIGGQSVWGVLGHLKSRPVVLVTAGMDSRSMFPRRAPGTNSAISGIIALLLAADSLARASVTGDIDFDQLPSQIGFGVFNAEAWGFTGSRRFAKDAWGQKPPFSCQNEVLGAESPTGFSMCLDPLYPSLEFRKLGHLEAVLHLDQVGRRDKNDTLYFHPSSKLLPTQRRAIIDAGSGLDMTVATSRVAPIPPSSLLSFIQNNASVGGAVFAGYDDKFMDGSYHSHWENDTEIDLGTIAVAADWLGRSAFLMAGGDLDSAQVNIRANITLGEEIMACLVSNWNCKLFRSYITSELDNLAESLRDRVTLNIPESPTLYPGVLQSWDSGGLPVVRRYEGPNFSGPWTEVAKMSDEWEAEKFVAYTMPGALEIFIRAFLTDILSVTKQPSGGRTGNDAKGTEFGGNYQCEVTSQCITSRQGVKEDDVDQATCEAECMRGKCICRSAFYHIAMDTGIERDVRPGYFHVVDPTQPNWAEPYWSTIGMTVFLDSGDMIGCIFLSVGLMFTLISVIASRRMLQALQKMKLM